MFPFPTQSQDSKGGDRDSAPGWEACQNYTVKSYGMGDGV